MDIFPGVLEKLPGVLEKPVTIAADSNSFELYAGRAGMAEVSTDRGSRACWSFVAGLVAGTSRKRASSDSSIMVFCFLFLVPIDAQYCGLRFWRRAGG